MILVVNVTMPGGTEPDSYDVMRAIKSAIDDLDADSDIVRMGEFGPSVWEIAEIEASKRTRAGDRSLFTL